MLTLLVRTPTESEMSLSNQVKESVNGAISSLRDALAFAARAEHPMTINTLSDILMRLESLECMDELMQRFGPKTTNDETPGFYRG